MKLIIAGSRNISLEASTIKNLIDIFKIGCVTEIVSGGCRGIDMSGEKYANSQSINIKQFLANWDKLGKKAGPIRNKQMAEYADALLVIRDGRKYSGSVNMKQQMIILNKPVHEVVINV